jgi:hypothetical protein
MRMSATRHVLAVMAVLLVAGVAGASPAVGIKAGLNMANWHGENYASTDVRYGFSGGGYIGFSVTPRVSVQAELLYTMKGTTRDEYEVTTTSKLSYLEVPLLARFTTTVEKGAHPYFVFGPALAFELSSRIRENDEEWDSEEICMDTKSPDIGLVFGTGVEFVPADGKGTVFIEVRYILGLRSINDSPADCCKPAVCGSCDECVDLGGPFDIKNRVISVSLGFGT